MRSGWVYYRLFAAKSEHFKSVGKKDKTGPGLLLTSRRSGDSPVIRSEAQDSCSIWAAKMLALVTESTKPFLFRIFGFVSKGK